MTTKNDELIKMWQDLYGLEKQAHDTYEGLLPVLKDDHERATIDEIHHDEERHMDIASKMLELAKEEK